MATVQSTLRMFDAMSGPLRSVTQALNLTISAMRQLNTATVNNADVARTLDAAHQRLAGAEADLANSAEQAAREQNNLNEELANGENAAFSLGHAIIVLNQGLELTQRLFGAIRRTMGFADEITSVNARLAMTTDAQRTIVDLQQQVLDLADETRVSYKATGDLITKLGLGTQGVFKDNDDMLRFAESFNKTLAISGATAMDSERAILQMSQALGSGKLQGDELRSLSETAPALMRILSDGLGVARGQLKQMGADGELTAEAIVKAFENQTDKIDSMFSTIPFSFGGAMTVIQNQIADLVGKLNSVGGPLEKLTGELKVFIDWLKSPAGDQFFAGITNGVDIAINSILLLVDWVVWIYNFLTNNWSTLEPIIWGIAAATTGWYLVTQRHAILMGGLAIKTAALTTAMFLQTLATSGLTVAWATLNAVQKANVFILIIAVIVGLIVWLVKLWKTNDDFAAGMMRAWNGILNFFDQVPIFFRWVGNGIVNTFQDMKVDTLRNFDSMVNGIIDSINWLAKQSNKFLGTSFEAISQVEFSAKAEIEAEGIRKAGAEAVAQMKEDAAFKAAEREQKVVDMLNDRASKRSAEEAQKELKVEKYGSADFGGSIPNIDKVGEVGKIKDSVDISSEDLKMMRELAEMKNIQNFVTLTPTVSVQTGDINNGLDADSLIDRITIAMEEEIASSARGEYT